MQYGVETKKQTKVEITGDKESIINEFGIILDSLIKSKVLNVDMATTIFSKVIYDNDL